MRDSKLFDEAVKKILKPIAQKHDLKLLKLKDGIYEIPSPHFIMRIRLHTGHRRGLGVLLRPSSLREFDEDKPGTQYGECLAEASERFGSPYLLGAGKNFDAIKEMVKQKTEKRIEEIKKYRFPKNVREEWI